MSQCEAKRSAAKEAAALVRGSLQRVLGVGSGTTVAHFMQALGELLGDREAALVAIPSSYQAEQLITGHPGAFRLSSFRALGEPQVDVSVDGADELQMLPGGRRLAMLKGGGGAMLGEKVVWSMARRSVWVVDEAKVSVRLGSKGLPVPLEVVPSALEPVLRQLRLGFPEGRASVRPCAGGKVGPVVTDHGNLVVDLVLPPESPHWDDLDGLNVRLKLVPGVVEHGLFLVDRDATIIVGHADRAPVTYTVG